MKVTVLGSGSAYGVPYVGGGWGNCDPNNPKNRRTCPSILIQDEATTLLVDMGPDYKEQSLRHNITKLDAVFFTHPHADHIAGMFHLPIQMAHQNGQNLALYADRATRRDIEKVWWYMFDPSIGLEYTGTARPLWREMLPPEQLQIGTLKLQTWWQQHGNRFKSVGLRIGNFGYSTDVSAFPEESEEYLYGLDTWFVDCNCVTNTDKSHGYVEQCLRWAEKFKPRQTYLTHLDYTVDYDTVSKMLPECVDLAYDGLVLEF
jgi:phosphoribosyl 1,2-cyclic phosphate phosphodiesterase